MDIITLIKVLVSGLLNAQEESKNEILNSTSSKGSRVYFCTVDIYSFIHSWYGYLSF